MRRFGLFAIVALAAGCGPKFACPPDHRASTSALPSGASAQRCELSLPDGGAVLDGLYLERGPRGPLAYGRFDHGVREGEWQTWYATGGKAERVGYVHGVKEGEASSWYPAGKRESQGSYLHGEKVGVWHYWDGNGKPRGDVDYGGGR